MKPHLLLLGTLLLLTTGGYSQHRGYTRMYSEPYEGGQIGVVDVVPVYVFSNWKYDARLVYNIKLVYPIAQEANRLLRQIETNLTTMPSKREQKAYIKAMEQQLKVQYTPVLRHMTLSQGKILIKLIDRETSQSSYELVRELRGGFSAFLWQGVARLFGANLKDTYDPAGEDRQLEVLVRLYEAGML